MLIKKFVTGRAGVSPGPVFLERVKVLSLEQNKIEIAVKLSDTYQELALPAYATSNSAGVDLLADIPADEPLTVQPGKRVLIPTGLSLALPDGYEAQVRPRSGLALKHGITILNTPGTIDADYRGEIKVILINLGEEPFVVERGMRIAQMIFAHVTQGQWRVCTDLSETARGAGGFGHSGV